MKIIECLTAFFNEYLFNPKWRCISCNREIFGSGYFCEKCKGKLPIIDGTICEHCGRKLKNAQNYCTTCKGKLVNLDKSRSVYSYSPPISALIKRMKYNNGRYLAQAFAEDLANLYFKSYINADLALFVPATKKALKKRGYNQSELLTKEFCKITNLPYSSCLEKVKETDRQATLSKEERLKNLNGAFKIKDKSQIKGKKVVVIDDVTTTGATAETLAMTLKKSGAKEVVLLTVASVPPKDGY